MPDGSQDQEIPERVQTIDLAQKFTSKDPDHKGDPVQLGEADRLSFARQILLWLVIITVFSFSAYILAPDNKGASDVFDLIKVGVLPLVTLVIGFYFPNSKK